MADVRAVQKWYNDKQGELGPLLATGSYPYSLEQSSHIPASIFQHHTVQKKLNDMRKNEAINASNRRRIPVPEDHPYFTQATMKTYLESFPPRFRIEEDKYKTFLLDNQPETVFYKSKTEPPMSIDGELKIHLMFDIKYLSIILNIVFEELIEPGTIPVMFKLLNYNPINAIAGRAGTPTPQFVKARANHYGYGVNNSKKQSYDRLGESFIYSPTEIKKYPVSHKGSTTFKLIARTRNNKDIRDEVYDFEALFDPVMVFYTMDDDYAQMLLRKLLEIFPDDRTRDWVLPNYYPRANVKINNMIYIGSGDYMSKYGNPHCAEDRSPSGTSQLRCIMNHGERLPDIPAEYEEIQSNCEKQKEQSDCDASNRFPLAVSNHKLCKWDEGQCKPKKTYSQHLILDRFNEVGQLYDTVGQRAVLEGFKASAANDSLPVNYNGGRRKTRNKRRKNNERRKKF
jgi:hypothetical protein